jgi:hypothetical protein
MGSKSSPCSSQQGDGNRGLQRLRPALDRFVLDRQLIKVEIRR